MPPETQDYDNRIELALFRHQKDCREQHVTCKYCEDEMEHLWDHSKSRAPKSDTLHLERFAKLSLGVVGLLLAAILTLFARTNDKVGDIRVAQIQFAAEVQQQTKALGDSVKISAARNERVINDQILPAITRMDSMLFVVTRNVLNDRR